MNLNRKKTFYKKFALLLGISLVVTLVASWRMAEIAPTITRAAVDVGSGGLKVTVAKVDPLSKKIKKILYKNELSVPLKRDLQVGGGDRFSEEIQQVALNTLKQLQTELAHHNSSEWKGIATAASRQASNANEMYEKIEQELGVGIQIISQNEEGRLGFQTAATVSSIDENELVAFDSGSGSFQLTTLIDGNLEVVEGKLGHIPSLEVLMNLRNKTLDLQTLPDPVTLEEAKTLSLELQKKLPEMSDSFAQKLKRQDVSVVGIGNENFIFAMGAKAVGKDTYTKEELWTAIEKHAGKSPEEMKHFSKPNEAVLGMVLLYSIMDGMGIDKLSYYYANGSCEGLLVDSTYWNEHTA